MQAESEKKITGIFQRIRALAKEQGLTGVDLAKKADVSYRTVFGVMREEPHKLQDRILSKFARALECSEEYLLTGTGDRNVLRDSNPDWKTQKKDSDEPTLLAALTKIARELNISFDSVAECFYELAKKSKNGEIK